DCSLIAGRVRFGGTSRGCTVLFLVGDAEVSEIAGFMNFGAQTVDANHQSDGRKQSWRIAFKSARTQPTDRPDSHYRPSLRARLRKSTYKLCAVSCMSSVLAAKTHAVGRTANRPLATQQNGHGSQR